MYTSKLFESYNQQLNEKINKDNIEINKAIANPNVGKNADKLKATGYELSTHNNKITHIKNPKTGKWINPTLYTRDEKQKIDFKGKLDSTRKNIETTAYVDDKAPKSAKISGGRYNADETKYYSNTNYSWEEPNYKSISKNINDYKKAVKDRDEKQYSADNAKNALSYYQKKIDDAKNDYIRTKAWGDKSQKIADDAEARRKAIIDNIRKRKTESEELSNEEFKVGDIVKVPYYNGTYTDDEYFTDAPIIDIQDNKYVTVEVPSKLEVTMDQIKKWNKGIDESENLNEEYSEKLGGDPEDFVSDVQSILDTLNTIDTSKFGSHLAEEIVEEFIETCNYQIERGKRLASGKEFYTESEKLKESTAYNTKSKEEFESVDDYKEAINDDIDTIRNTLEDLKPRMNTDDAVEVLETSKAMINSTLLDRAYN